MGKQRWQEMLEEVSRQFDAGLGGHALVEGFCTQVDALLLDMWSSAMGELAAEVDLVAVGGYGRREQAPQSDLDLWFLVPENCPGEIEEGVQQFLYALWDMKIKVGYAIRTVKQTLTHVDEDWNSATAALEARLLAGEGRLYDRMQSQLARFFQRKRKLFVAAKLDEVDARHQKTGGTAFLMEPDIKENKGGLRDVQAVFWMAKAWFGIHKIDELVNQGALSDTEKVHLQGAQDFLLRVRVGLHLEMRRPSDRLGFEQQAMLGERMGYVSATRPAVESFMKDYFRHAGRIARVSGLLMMHFREVVHPRRFVMEQSIGDGFTLTGDLVGIRDESMFSDEPLRLLRVFNLAQKNHRQLSSQILRQIRANVLLIDDDFLHNPKASEIFLNILRHPRNVAKVLKEMNDTGVLGRFIPAFREVVGLGQFNRYHAYTVDEHTLRAIAEARNMYHGERQTRMALAHDVWKRIDSPELLFIALLFHDIAKGMPGDHSIEGEKLACAFCRRLGLDEDATALVGWLVREHLTMAMVSQRSDLSDPEVISNFAERIGDVGRLNYLLLLTVADIAAVGPGVWNDWKGSLLHELYSATERVLRGGAEQGVALQERIRLRRESTLLDAGEEQERLRPELELLPWRCIMHFPPRHLLPMVRMLAEHHASAGVEVLNDQVRCETLVMTVAAERSGLFASLAAAISSGHTNIVAAQAYDLSDGRALSVFHVQGADGSPLAMESDLNSLRRRIEKALQTPGELKRPVQPTFRVNVLMQKVTVQARELLEASSENTAIEVTAADRPGLLSQFTYVINQHGHRLQAASITTFGERVVDVFFLRGQERMHLTQDESEKLCKALEEVARLPDTD